MTEYQILAGPDRLAFINSLFNDIDSDPTPEFMSPPHSHGEIQPPPYRGEAFNTKDKDVNERQLILIITSSTRRARGGMVQVFTAVLWAACDEFRDLIFGNSCSCWVEFKGELDFTTQKGWLERIES